MSAAAFDKTGRLTEDRPKVTDVVGLGGKEEDVDFTVRRAGGRAKPPVVAAILGRSKEEGSPGPPAIEVQAVAGKDLKEFIRGESMFFGSHRCRRNAPQAAETADAASLHGRVTDVIRMVKLSRKTMANIRQNIAVALGLKAVFLVTTILGVTGLWPAILADTGATVLVTANAMRLLGAGREL